MTKKQTASRAILVRLDDELFERLDARVAQLRKQMPGHRITRVDVVRSILLSALKEVKGSK